LVAGPGITYALLRSSKVQTFLVKHVATYLSNELETKVEVGGLDISFFLNIVLQDVKIEDRNGKPMVKTKRMVFDIGKISLRQRHLLINKLYLEEAYLGLKRYQDSPEFNFQFFIDYFSKNDQSVRRSEKHWDVVCKSLEFNKSGFSFNDENHIPSGPGFDKYHVDIADFRMAVNTMFLEDNKLSFNLEQLTFTESNGFKLNYLSGWFAVSPQSASASNVLIRSEGSKISLDLTLQYDGFESFLNTFDQVGVSLTLYDSKIDMSDVAYYFPELYGLQDEITVSGEFIGKPSDLNASNINISYGMHTSFAGDFSIQGLPEINDTRFNFTIHELNTSIADLQNFRMPGRSSSARLDIPENIKNLNMVSFQGAISGYLKDMIALGSFKTSLGNINANLALRKIESALQYAYTGHVSTTSFKLGRFLGNDSKIGFVSLDAEIKGKGIDLESMEVDLNGKIKSLELAGYRYENLNVTGHVGNKLFNGLLIVNDENLGLNFVGVINFEEDIPVFDFQAQVNHANLTVLKLYQRTEETESVVSASLNINARGGTLDELTGQLDFSDITYEERLTDQAGETHETKYHTEIIRLVNTNLPNNNKAFYLSSDYIDASLIGQVNFKSLGTAVKNYLASHIPAFFPEDNAKQSHAGMNDKYDDQKLEVWIHFKNTNILSELFFPAIELADDSKVSIKFDSQHQVLDIHGKSDMLTFLGNRFVDWNMIGTMTAESYQITNQSARLLLTDSLHVNNFCLDGHFFNDTLFYEAVWRSFDADNVSHGHIQGITRFIDKHHAELRFLPSYATINDSKWSVNIDNEVLFDSARVEISNLVVYNDEQLFNITGVLSSDPYDKMHVHFHDFQFSNLEPIIRAKNMSFEGIVNGVLSLTALYQSSSFEADLQVGNFAFNNDILGDLSVKSEWVEATDGFRVEAAIINTKLPLAEKSLQASGFIFPNSTDDVFDINIDVNNLTLSVWSRYLNNFAQDFHGHATGSLRLKGPLSNPELSGLVNASQAGFRIDYLKTRYEFSHPVRIERNAIAFNNLTLLDTLGNSGLASGTIWHNNFSDFSMDIRIRPERMIVLNTNAVHNELYYGRAFASGLLHIHGNEDDIIMDISARTNRGTQMFLPLTYTGEVVESNFITFVTKDTTLTHLSFPAVSITGVTLNFDLEVTPDAEVQLIFDSQIGDIIRGRGNGNLKLEISSQGAFNMYGEYIIQEGEYLFTLQNLINKRFRIEQGGAIRWTGDPNNADVDLRAAYRLRTSLYDLMMDVDTTDTFRRRVPVECILILEDKLFNPRINFDIHLPGGDESIRELIERRITTEQEMNRQIFSLLILNRFMPATADQYNTALGYGVGSTSSELLSNQLSNWLSQISSEFDIGINYRPGDQISSQELEVALSTQLFDDRVIIDGNLGVAGPNSLTNQRTSSIIGDVNVEVKITPEGKFRIKAFNRSNTFDILNTNSPYTQGVGVFYRKEFDSLTDLFKRSNRPEEISEVTD
jgi:hypothetical protein